MCDSLARGPTEFYLQIFNEFVSQLTDDEPTTGYYQQDGATCHTANAVNVDTLGIAFQNLEKRIEVCFDEMIYIYIHI
jgi:hypothetical protein